MVLQGSGVMFSLLMIVAMSVQTSAQEQQTSSSFVLGDVVIKFRPKTKVGESIDSKAGTSGPTEPLLDYLRGVSAELSVPLQVKRLGSGGSVILTINQAELLASWSERLRAKENVNRVQLSSVAESPRSVEPSLYVEFAKGTPEEKVVSQLAASRKDSGPALQAIAEGLRQELGVPLLTTVEGPGRLQIRLDIRALTLNLVERLKAKDEIEYAQPNFIRGRMGPTR
jgi:hypothetical protein